MTAQVIFLPPFPISYEESRKNELLQDKINEQRVRIKNWALDKSPGEVAQAWMAWRDTFKGCIYLIKPTEDKSLSNF